jgi:hypothetical protein
MKVGKVYISLSYTVDLDNPNMVDEAKDCLFEDITNAVKYNELAERITIEETPNESPKNIPDFLKESSIDDDKG